jgi:glycosyltransferase involved in cell wall biosynthesis
MRLFRRSPDLVIPYRFRRPPYGGSNQFLVALRGELRRRGLHVSDGAFGRDTRACLLHSYLVDVDRLGRELPDGCQVVHRVDGPIQFHRNDDSADREILEINSALANATVFQSQWSLETHRRLGIELRDPAVIPNAVDSSIFHPPAEREPGGPRLRVIATSWSHNPRKGAATFAALARASDSDRYEFTFVGRAQAPLDGARQLAPLASRELAEELRAHDVYVAPSVDEACSNAVLEALACGLPVLYRRSGSHAEIVGEAGLGFDDEDEAVSQLDRLAEELAARRDAIRIPTLSAVADRYLEVLGLAAR